MERRRSTSDRPAGGPPVIEIADLHKSFGPLEVLKGISFSASEGEVVALIGSSGSGKSTLLRCINMLEIPDSGGVRRRRRRNPADRHRRRTAAIADESQFRRIRTELGMVFQSFNLWSHMTILENVMEAPLQVQKPRPRRSRGRGPRDARQGRHCRQGARTIRPSSRAASSSAPRSPGLCASTPGSCCSTSRPRRSTRNSRARSLRVIKLLADEGRTMLLVTHDMDFAKTIADRVRLPASGPIEEEGTVDEVFGATKSPRLQPVSRRRRPRPN